MPLPIHPPIHPSLKEFNGGNRNSRANGDHTGVCNERGSVPFHFIPLKMENFARQVQFWWRTVRTIWQILNAVWYCLGFVVDSPFRFFVFSHFNNVKADSLSTRLFCPNCLNRLHVHRLLRRCCRRQRQHRQQSANQGGVTF